MVYELAMLKAFYTLYEGKIERIRTILQRPLTLLLISDEPIHRSRDFRRRRHYRLAGSHIGLELVRCG